MVATPSTALRASPPTVSLLALLGLYLSHKYDQEYCYVVPVVNMVRKDYALGLHTVRELNMICRNHVLRTNVTSEYVSAYDTFK